MKLPGVQKRLLAVGFFVCVLSMLLATSAMAKGPPTIKTATVDFSAIPYTAVITGEDLLGKEDALGTIWIGGYEVETYTNQTRKQLDFVAPTDISAPGTYLLTLINDYGQVDYELAIGTQGEQGPPGDDGYTPQKGVDYFDGASGATGPQGIPGVVDTTYYQALCDLYHATGTTPPSSCDAYPGLSKIVFISSTLHTGNLGGLDGADQICNDLAQAANLPGNYLAWLSAEGTSPATRFSKSNGPYILVNGVIVQNNWVDLTDPDSCLINPINIDEQGVLRNSHVWTNTRTNGEEVSSAGGDTTCEDFSDGSSTPNGSAVAGSPTYYDNACEWWTFEWPMPCNYEGRLYCFQQ